MLNKNNNSTLIVGLGNFPIQYNNTRHNVGFMAIDKLCDILNLELNKNKYHGLYVKYKTDTNLIYIAKPLTLMNKSGEFIKTIIKEEQIKNIVVICDDINLSLGEIRCRKVGSSGGHNGLKNIIENLNTNNFFRVRIGIGKPNGEDLSHYVLSKFSANELTVINNSIIKVNNFLLEYIKNNNDLLNKNYSLN